MNDQNGQLSFYDTLTQARTELWASLDDGTTCPCCGQHAQRYRWSLYGTAVRALLLYLELGGDGPDRRYVHTNELKLRGHKGQGDATRLAMWGLLEESHERREDGGKSGWWRVTDAGVRFVRGYAIPKYAYVYNNVVDGHDGPLVTIADRLGHPFDWNRHMRGLTA